MIKLFGFLILLLSARVAGAGDREFGHPLFRTFTTRDYGEVGQIFAVTQHPEGPMLFGGKSAVVVFDNNRWQRIPLLGVGYIRSLAVDSRGAIWFSSSTEIGYLSKIDGEYRTVTVLNGSFGADCRVIIGNDQVCFSTEAGLLLWKDGNLSQHSWPINPLNRTLAISHGKICIGDRNGSIYEFDGSGFKKIAESPLTNAGGIRAIVDCPIGDGLMVCSSAILEKVGSTLVSWRTDIDSLLTSSAILAAKWVQGKYLAVVVQSRGVYLLNQQGKLVESFTVNPDLADAGFETIGDDEDGGLWVCTDTELTRIQCGAGSTEFDHEQGLPKGFVTGVGRFKGKIYAATQHGVYVLNGSEEASEAAHFVRFGDRNERFFWMTISGSNAFAISEFGTYALDPGSSKLNRIGSGGITISPSLADPSRVFLGTVAGLESVHYSDGQWLSEGLLAELPYAIEGMADSGAGDLFLCVENEGFYRVQLRKGAEPIFRDARVERLLDTKNREVPSGEGTVCRWQGQMLFVGENQVWQLPADKDRLEPFALAAKSLPGREIQTIANSQLTDDYLWVSSRPQNAGTDTGFEIGRLYVSGRYEALSHNVSYPLGLINSAWDEMVEGKPVAWIAGDYGLMRVFLNRPESSRSRFQLYANQITTADGAPISIRDGQEVKLKYDDRDFQIRFGTDRFSAGNDLYYQANLEGNVVHQWPTITMPVWRSGGLNEGHYLLHVQARDSDGYESKAYTLAFVIEPPWYRTAWMEIIWGILAILMVYLFIRWRTWQMTLRERELVQTVELRTRELRQHETELEKAKEHAEAASRSKTAFLASMSHELRTPINSILGYAQILLRRGDSGNDGGARLRTILASGEHLLEMINEVLDLSRIESGKLSIELRSLDLPKFIAGIVDEFQLRASEGHLRFVHEIRGELPEWIEADPLRLRQVLYNLLGNAVKFTTQGEVAFRVYVTPTQLRFEVKDTGKGIPPEDLSSIFQPFYQASNNQLIGQGVGLGLNISKQIVELFGGNISVDSELGRGSTFCVEIPRRDANSVSPKPSSRRIIGYEGPPQKILVLDDEPLNRLMLRELLSTVGFDTVAAESTEQALSLLKDRFDAVISDIRMPGNDGNVFCRQLRSSDATKDLIVIASSASVFADDQRMALASGFNDFLPKPVMEEELFEILGRHLRVKWVYAKTLSS